MLIQGFDQVFTLILGIRFPKTGSRLWDNQEENEAEMVAWKKKSDEGCKEETIWMAMTAWNNYLSSVKHHKEPCVAKVG